MVARPAWRQHRPEIVALIQGQGLIVIGGVLSFAMEFRYNQEVRCCQQGRRATNRNHVLRVAKLNGFGFVASRQETLLLRFGVRDLVDDQSDTAFGENPTSLWAQVVYGLGW